MMIPNMEVESTQNDGFGWAVTAWSIHNPLTVLNGSAGHRLHTGEKELEGSQNTTKFPESTSELLEVRVQLLARAVTHP